MTTRSDPHTMPRADDRMALPVEQGVLLWCIRIWVTGLHHDVSATARIEDMLGRLGVREAGPYFDGFMFALSHGAARKIEIQCVCQPRVGADERTLLDAIGLAQERRPFEALLLLRQMVTPDAARAALRSAEGFGTELALAGRFLPAPDGGLNATPF